MTSESDIIRYDLWIEDALRDVIKRALTLTAQEGLPGEHHFYITFETQAEGVLIPDYLRAQHAEEMTIVLQHQFDNLLVGEDEFEVTLRFKGKPERLLIPYEAITGFADPSVNFGLQLKMAAPDDAEDGDEEMPDTDEAPQGPPAEVTAITPVDNRLDEETAPEEAAEKPGGDDQKSGEVIALDTFRKKQQ